MAILIDYVITPEQFGIERQAINTIAVSGIEDSLEIFHSVLDNVAGPARDIVCLNAGAAIYVAGLSNSIAEGVAKADEVISNGEARGKLQQLIKTIESFA